MRIDPQVQSHIEMFLTLAKKYPGETNRRLWPPKRKPESYGFSAGKARRFVYVFAGIFRFCVESQTGEVRDGARRKCLRYGTIADLIAEKDWKNGGIRHDRNCVPVNHAAAKACGACGRKARVRATVVGERCQYCRGADTRHIGAIRRLGGRPTVDGRPLERYLKDDAA